MKFNSLVEHRMSVWYHTWEPEVRADTLTYRSYQPGVLVPVTVVVNGAGYMQLYSNQKLQAFSIISEVYDSEDTQIMEGQWYNISKIHPIMTPFGDVSSYRHAMANLDASLIAIAIDAPKPYPSLDQT